MPLPFFYNAPSSPQTVIFPWRPKRAASAKEEVAAHAAICGLTLAWLLAIPMSGFQPLQATMLGMLLMNIWKQYQFFPVAQGTFYICILSPWDLPLLIG